jgi:hypothetical protein
MSTSSIKRLSSKVPGRYRFQGFSERISNIQLDILHRISHVETSSGLADSFDSYFLTLFGRLSELNCSASFLSLSHALRPLISSYPLLLHHQTRVLDILLLHLASPYSLCKSSILELIAELARDLRSEFAPHFPRVASTLLSLLNPLDPESIETSFNCLLLLFKYLLKSLVSDVKGLFLACYVSLLQHKKVFIRRFAAESLGFLIRKLNSKQYKEVLCYLIGLHTSGGEFQANSPFLSIVKEQLKQSSFGSKQHLIKDSSSYEDGIACLLFESLKNIHFTFHSSFPLIYPLLLQFLHFTELTSLTSAEQREEEIKHRFNVLFSLNRKLCNHTRAEQAIQAWKAMQNRLTVVTEEFIKFISDTTATTKATPAFAANCSIRSLEMSNLLDFLSLWSSFRSGSRLIDPSLIPAVLRCVLQPVILNCLHLNQEFIISIIHLFTTYISHPLSASQVDDLSTLLDQLLSSHSSRDQNGDVAIYLPLIVKARDFPSFKPVFFRLFIKFFSSISASFESSENSSLDGLFSCLAELSSALCVEDLFFYQQKEISPPVK